MTTRSENWGIKYERRFPFDGLFRFIIVGKFDGVTHADIRSKIEAAGGCVDKRMRKRTEVDYAIVGESKSRDWHKVMNWGVPTWTVEDLDRVIAGEIWWDEVLGKFVDTSEYEIQSRYPR